MATLWRNLWKPEKLTANVTVLVKELRHLNGGAVQVAGLKGRKVPALDVEGLAGDEVAVDEAGAFVGVREEDAHPITQAVENLFSGLWKKCNLRFKLKKSTFCEHFVTILITLSERQL